MRSSHFSLWKKNSLAHYYANTKFTAKLTYLCDIFSRLNLLNISLQRRTSNIIVVADKVQAFKRKSALWTKRAQEKRMDMFPLSSDILENSPEVKIGDSVSQHLFYIVATAKTKDSLRATLEATLRVSLFPIPPRLDLIVSQRLHQVSH